LVHLFAEERCMTLYDVITWLIVCLALGYLLYAGVCRWRKPAGCPDDCLSPGSCRSPASGRGGAAPSAGDLPRAEALRRSAGE